MKSPSCRCNGEIVLHVLGRVDVLKRLGIASLQALEKIDDLLFASGHVASVVGSFRVRAVDSKRYYAGYDAGPKLTHEVHVHESTVVNRPS